MNSLLKKDQKVGCAPPDASQRKEPGLGGEPDGDRARLFVVANNFSSHYQRIEAIIAACGGMVCFIEEPTSPEKWPAGSNILLVALGFEPDSTDSILPAIRTFKQRGFTVVALADGLERWALSSRCLLLL